MSALQPIEHIAVDLDVGVCPTKWKCSSDHAAGNFLPTPPWQVYYYRERCDATKWKYPPSKGDLCYVLSYRVGENPLLAEFLRLYHSAMDVDGRYVGRKVTTVGRDRGGGASPSSLADA